MTLQRRLKALESVQPDDDQSVKVIWHSLCSREGDVVVERLAFAWIAAGPNGDREDVARADDEAEDPFEARVIAAALRIHGRTDEAFAAGLRFTSRPCNA